MKKIINRPEQVVTEMCQGMALAHPELLYSEKYRFITRKKLSQDKVTLISGGGSGHEPAHAGFVGEGMLDAAVCGDVFASPSQIQVYQIYTPMLEPPEHGFTTTGKESPRDSREQSLSSLYRQTPEGVSTPASIKICLVSPLSMATAHPSESGPV